MEILSRTIEGIDKHHKPRLVVSAGEPDSNCHEPSAIQTQKRFRLPQSDLTVGAKEAAMSVSGSGGTMTDSVEERLASLFQLSTQRLRKLWLQLFPVCAPPPLRKNLLISVLAFRIQEQAFGGHRAELRKRLRELVKADVGAVGSLGKPVAKPGTRLVRQWGGHAHVVTVGETCYEYRGARFESLSEIARRITGTRWSGPLFFGLKDGQRNQGERTK